MPYKIEIRSLAKIEIFEAFDWYDAQREGLGLEFLNELEAFYKRLDRNPFSYSFYDEQYQFLEKIFSSPELYPELMQN